MHEQLRGAITMLFTDMEGSTRLLRRMGADFAPLLEGVRGILRDAVVSHNGVEVDSQGDGFFFVFQHAAEAVSAAVDAQRALAQSEWPEHASVLIRMGMHTGDPVRSAGNFVGIDVHIAARICNASHGGQVVLSEATLESINGPVGDGVGLKDLGIHHLKDLARGEHLFQMVIPELRADFPPMRALSGLAEHLDAVIKAVGEGRLVLVLGEGANLSGRPTTGIWEPGSSRFAPTDTELAGHLAQAFGYPQSDPRELARVSQHVAASAGQGPLYEKLHAALDVTFAPTPLHELLAAIPSILRALPGETVYPLIISTSYDDTLERAFQRAGEPFDLVSYAVEGENRGRFVHSAPDGRVRMIDKPNKYLGVSPDQRPVIMRFNGLFDRANPDRDSFVLTEDDYFDYLVQSDLSTVVPVMLAAALRRSHIVFLGYNLRVWNHRMLLHRLWGRERLKYHSWVIQPSPEAIDFQYWRRYDVEVLDAGLDDYVGQLEERLQDMEDHRPSSDPAIAMNPSRFAAQDGDASS